MKTVWANMTAASWRAALVPIFPWVVNTVDVLIYEP